MKNYPKQTEIREYILSQYPNEAVGVICDGEFFPLNNIHVTPETHFKIDDSEYLKLSLKHKIDYLVHSHTYSPERKPIYESNPCTPSQLDYVNQKKSNVQWLIYATEGENVTLPVEFPQSTDTELLGKEFIFYINDCFSLIRDYYHQKLGIELPPHSETWTWEDGATTNCYEEFFKEWGFVKVPIQDLQLHDVLVMSVLGDCNHAGIFVEDGYVMQHLIRRKSELMELHRIRSWVQFVVRYKKDA